MKRNKKDEAAHGGVALAYALPTLALACVRSGISPRHEVELIDRPTSGRLNQHLPVQENPHIS